MVNNIFRKNLKLNPKIFLNWIKLSLRLQEIIQNYSLIFEETGKVPKASQIHLFDFIITYSTISGTFKIEEPELKLETLNRSTLDVKNINVSNNYITVDNEDWFRCRSTDLADMILTQEKNAIISREDPNFK